MGTIMKLNENFVSRFLQNVMKGVISKKEKNFLQSNPEIANQVKKLKQNKDRIAQLIADLD